MSNREKVVGFYVVLELLLCTSYMSYSLALQPTPMRKIISCSRHICQVHDKLPPPMGKGAIWERV